MELTVEQAMQQAVAAQSQSKLEEVEGFYRAILQSQPTHPEANHNLGLTPCVRIVVASNNYYK
jgi:hypothetical protein